MLSCVECGAEICANGTLPDVQKRRIIMHIWLAHPEFIDREGQIQVPTWDVEVSDPNELS